MNDRNGGTARATPRVCVVLNPAAGRGRGARVEPAVRRAFAAVGVRDVRVTAAPGDAQRLARRAIDDGAETVVAVGGDGTWSHVGGAIVASGADVRLALVAAGRGNDYAKSVGAPAGDYHATARMAVDGPDARVDVGRVDPAGPGAGLGPGTHFLNAAGFGFDVAVLEAVARARWLRGELAYAYGALRQLGGYRGLAVANGAAGGAAALHLMLVLANGRHFGGAFRIAPAASLTDGLLDAVAVGDAAPGRRVALFAAAVRGAHVRHAEVRVERAAHFALAFDAPPAYQADGEVHAAASAELEVRCLPAALRVVTAALP